MPAIALKNVAAGTPNALDGLKFQELPAGGAFITIYASTALPGGNIDYAVGSKDFLKSAELNPEEAADVVNTDRDLVLPRQPVPAGKQFLAVNDQAANVLLVIE